MSFLAADYHSQELIANFRTAGKSHYIALAQQKPVYASLLAVLQMPGIATHLPSEARIRFPIIHVEQCGIAN